MTTTPEQHTAPVGTLEHLDPQTVTLEDNVRDAAALDADFLASITEHGVLQPVTAVRTGEEVRIRDGQRRTLAARQAGLPTIPVYVLDAPDGAAERIAHQIVTNDQRTALTDAQRVRGIQQMLDAGLSATKVAQKLSVPRDTVKAAARAAASATALDALDTGQLSLTEAAALTEFDGDTEAVAALIAAAGGPQFAHRFAQLRQDRLAEAARAEVAADYTRRGFTILTERPGWRDTGAVALAYLRTPDGARVDEEAVTDPAHWAVLLVEDSVYVDTTTGEPVDAREVDWATERDPDRTPDEGRRHATTVTETVVWAPEYFCRDPQAAGLTLADFLQPRPDTPAPEDAPSAEDRAETERAQRRQVLALNKLGLAAQEVRRGWVRERLLSRKTPAKGTTVFVARCLEQGPGLLTDHNARHLAADLLGVDDLRATLTRLTTTGDARAQVLLLGMALAALEGRTPKDAWRHAHSGYAPTPGAAEYLRFLAGHGYPLAPIEQVVTGERTADDVYRDTETGD
ncbi:ParB N-terminal domain-containing protein [Mycobacterium sp. GA-2829]|uniref:ParB/RepB/Spo0J family partition protein n=1 Tax=Mycobacterium sp. GA-2829 TaxID=1772283 RepID=UPI00074029F4|nr:ParB N-terminal domain-containing protein [Mycobacterium sp. GA-2829]KUI34195.1 hypothetical protein AU194_17750 [Mycobacterium sp. GA-2829]